METIDEIHEIMLILRGGDAKSDGDFRAKHLGTTLSYLRKTKTENKNVTLSKLSLILGMANRQIRENYFDGLVNFGIINMDTTCNSWFWIGVSALKSNGELINKQQEQEQEQSLVDHAKKYPHCYECQKPIPKGLQFCSKECMDKYKEKGEGANKE